MDVQQEEFNLSHPVGPVESVEKFQFDPIQGYPMLNWKGKRPFRFTQYYPAQLKESFGQHTDTWMNRIFWGDNLQVMSHLLKEFRGQIKLIYIDPPFDSKADYKKKISLRGKRLTNDLTFFEEKQYSDIWTNDEYLQFMYERFILLRELLHEEGNLFVHCDDTKNYLLRSLLDEVFSNKNFRNEIIWKRSTSTGLSMKRCGTLHDTIYWYTKSSVYTFNMQYHEYEEDYLKRARKDENGRLYIPIPTGNPGLRPNLYYSYKGYLPHSNGYKWTYERMEQYEKEGRLVFPENKDGRIQYKQFLDEMEGVKLQDIWLDIPAVNPVAQERNGYPTQKPEALLERIIKMASNPGDIIFDCFMGSGTTLAVALKNSRRFIGADINLGAVQISTNRLLNEAHQIGDLSGQATQQEFHITIDDETGEEVKTAMPKIDKYYRGFNVYNVNHYDMFRNPVQARELLIEALEIQPLSYSSVYDGEKDGRMVKIMPINRIATRADLNELITGFDYKIFESRKEDNPNKPVEKILLVCMGHEPDLAATLKSEVDYELDVQVVDILKDKSQFEFKRDSEARISIKDNQLFIENFYPMNLLQKLSIEKANVEDWRELVESIMIDWNYNGDTMKSDLVDIPASDGIVRGVYQIPQDSGSVRVKIVDLLSESLEVDVHNG